MKIGKLIFGISTSCLIALGGCSSNTKIGDENAIEVAIDEANAKEEDVKNLSCDSSEEGYTVSFDLNGLQYVYKISNAGIIESSRTKHLANTEKIIKADSDMDNNEIDKNKENSSKDSDENNTEDDEKKSSEEKTDISNESEESEANESSETTITESDAVLISLDYLGISEDKVSKVKTSLNDDNNYQVTFKYDSYNCAFLIDSKSGDILSAVIQ